MFNKSGRGFNRGGGSGFGFRGNSPDWPYVGRGRGRLPRCHHPGIVSYPRMNQEEELSSLKNRAQALKEQIERVEASISRIEKETNAK